MNIIRISDLESPRLQVFSGLSETQLLHCHEPAPGLFIAESEMIISRALAAGYLPELFLTEEKYLDRVSDLLSGLPPAYREEVPVYTAPCDVLTHITGYALTRGILCAMKRKKEKDPEPLLKAGRRIVVLENVMNPRNLGTIFRSAAALGMDAVLLTKGCCDPLYRRSARVSMGTVFQIPWAFLHDWPDDLRKLQEEGFLTAAMALKDHAIPLEQLQVPESGKVAVIMGTEGPGLQETTIRICDVSVIIPMAHGVDSLNVAAASAVAFWQINHSSAFRPSP